MLNERCKSSRYQLIAAIICIILFVLPGVVVAETPVNTTSGPVFTTSLLPGNTGQATTPVPTVHTTQRGAFAGTPVNNSSGITVMTSVATGVTSQAATPVPTASLVRENMTLTTTPPPLLILGTPSIENLTCTMYGTVTSGSVNKTLVSTRWDWGDSRLPEYHGFPYSHVYSSPDNYTLSITALQSDGQNTTKTVNISVMEPVIPGTPPVPLNGSIPGSPGGPGMKVLPPALTLLEPVIDRMNVTLNGNLNPGSPGVTIESVNVDWNDGNITKSTDLPITHQYYNQGIFTIAIRGNQSDGQSTTKRITLDLKEEPPTIPGQATSGPPSNEMPVYLIILVTAIIVVVIVAMVQRIAKRKKETPHHADIPKTFSPRAGSMQGTLPSPEELVMICSGTDVSPEVLGPVIRVAVEIAREGREGQAIGTSFVVGDTENVLSNSKQFVLNPFHGYHETKRQITDSGVRGNIKEFAQLDGAFLVSGTGVVEAAGRCITVDLSNVDLPGGLGSRHSSVAGITQVTKSVGVVVSQSGGLISIFRGGKIVYTINS